MTTQTTAPTPTDRPELYIDGRWQAGSGGTVELIEAATEHTLGTSAAASEADIDLAVAAAARARPGWAATAVADRAAALDRFAAELKARASATAALCSRENGMPISLSIGANGFAPSMMLSYYAELIRSRPESQTRPSTLGSRTVVLGDPIGVIGAITPWNYPQALAMMKIAPALAAGCTVVLKPSPETALDAYVFADAAHAAGLPAGVLNIVPGGREAGARLVEHPQVNKVAFTGSTAAGRAIGEVCGRLLRPVTLELGGKSAAIVLDDADLDAFTAALPELSLANNGQTCHACTRILAPRSRYDEVLEAVTATVGALTVGDPLDRATQIGPLVSRAQRDRVLGYIQAGRDEGLQITTGGGRPAGLDRGWFVEPTVFAGVDNGSRIAQEEIFGPVLTVQSYDDDQDAVAIANDSPYGLGGSVWTADEQRGEALARQVQTGTIGVNHYALDFAAPFGGVKASGLGRELGPEGLAPYLQTKSIYF